MGNQYPPVVPNRYHNAGGYRRHAVDTGPDMRADSEIGGRSKQQQASGRVIPYNGVQAGAQLHIKSTLAQTHT